MDEVSTIGLDVAKTVLGRFTASMSVAPWWSASA